MAFVKNIFGRIKASFEKVEWVFLQKDRILFFLIKQQQYIANRRQLGKLNKRSSIEVILWIFTMIMFITHMITCIILIMITDHWSSISNNIIIMIMISNTPAGVKKQAEGGSYPLYQLVNLNGDGDDRGGAQDAET